MQPLASAVVVLALFAGCDRSDAVDPSGAAGCYGGFGVAVHVVPGTCPQVATFAKSQIKLSGSGAEQAFDFTWVVDTEAEAWPPGFQRGERAHVDVLVYAENAPCQAKGMADVTIDPEVCTLVDVATTCTCLAP
jgi:hypothetical protein